MWIGAQYSLLGIAIGHLAAGIIEVIVRLIVAMQVVEITLKDIVSQLGAFIGCVVIVIVTFPILILTNNASPVVQLAATALGGAIGYLLSVWYLEREIFLLVLNTFTGLVKRFKYSASSN